MSLNLSVNDSSYLGGFLKCSIRFSSLTYGTTLPGKSSNLDGSMRSNTFLAPSLCFFGDISFYLAIMVDYILCLSKIDTV